MHFKLNAFIDTTEVHKIIRFMDIIMIMVIIIYYLGQDYKYIRIVMVLIDSYINYFEPIRLLLIDMAE